MPTSHKLLLIDDEPNVREAVKDFLTSRGHAVEVADSCQMGQSLFQSFRPDAVVTDHRLSDGNALDLLARLKEIEPSVPVIILTGYGSIDLAVQAMKLGAEHFLTKPVELPVLALVIDRVIENERNRRTRMVGKAHSAREQINPFVGTSPAIRELSETAQRVLQSQSTILIRGETGTGKGVLARWLHEQGPRRDETFVDLNCAGLSREFLESELFGHEKGAFTGASASKLGLLEVAHKGTVFLDEIGDVDLAVQPKLLKVLEEKQFRRLGDVRDRVVDIRMIAATHQNLTEWVAEKKFRGDLYFRISTLPLRVPALRERPEDIPLLAHQLLGQFATHWGRAEVRLSDAALQALRAYSWPGNIRELKNVLERAVLLRKADLLSAEDLRFEGAPEGAAPALPTHLTLAELERHHIEQVLREEKGRVSEAAKRLGIPRSSLYEKVKRLKLSLSES